MPLSHLVDELSYTAYSFNRDRGMTHAQLRSVGVGNDAMAERYENEKMDDTLDDEYESSRDEEDEAHDRWVQSEESRALEG